jgi:5-methylcytosine-specific restriction endonuclease McrA
MSNSIPQLRIRAFERQHGRCYYCELPMWTKSPLTFGEYYRLSPKQARHFECTAEHLHAKRDGGGNRCANIVAACRHCNATRHKRKSPLSPDQWRIAQRGRASRRWSLHRAGGYQGTVLPR